MRKTRVEFVYPADISGDAEAFPFTGPSVCYCGGEVVYRPGVRRGDELRFGECIKCGTEYSGREVASYAPSMLLD